MRCTSVKELLHLLDAVHDPVPVHFDLQLAAYLNDSSGRQDVRALAAALTWAACRVNQGPRST